MCSGASLLGPVCVAKQANEACSDYQKNMFLLKWDYLCTYEVRGASHDDKRDRQSSLLRVQKSPVSKNNTKLDRSTNISALTPHFTLFGSQGEAALRYVFVRGEVVGAASRQAPPFS